MPKAVVITPVKDSPDNTLMTIQTIKSSNLNIIHQVYNDFSSIETKLLLETNQPKYDFELINLEDITDHPSPNYRLVLQEAQKKALFMGLPLIIVESDVEVKPDTFDRMISFYNSNERIGLLGAVTVDEDDNINFPYLRFKKPNPKSGFTVTGKSLSFCCTLISKEFLAAYDFSNLNQSKHWYDTFLSDQAVKMGFRNILLTDTRVLHKPHGSRPWKHLKYTNPIKYYWLKITKSRDKI